MTQKGYLPVSIKVFKEGTSKDVPYVAYAPELDVSAAGKDPYSAKKALQEVIEYLIKKREKEGKLDIFLQELGFKGLGTRDELEPPEVSFIQIPFRFSSP